MPKKSVISKTRERNPKKSPAVSKTKAPIENLKKNNQQLINNSDPNEFVFNHNEIEKALFKRAQGYEYSEETTTGDSDEKTTRVVKKFAIPDVTACIFWLKNRLPDKWKDPKDIDSEKLTLKDFLEHYYDEEESCPGK